VKTPRRPGSIAYVINEPCIGVKDASCTEVCPVDCIHSTPDEPGFADAEQLYIDPEECIDCDACVEACPVDAITPGDRVPPDWEHLIERTRPTSGRCSHDPHHKR
jgi:ferredoxin